MLAQALGEPAVGRADGQSHIARALDQPDFHAPFGVAHFDPDVARDRRGRADFTA
jgi:hypothetical protein